MLLSSPSFLSSSRATRALSSTEKSASATATLVNATNTLAKAGLMLVAPLRI